MYEGKHIHYSNSDNKLLCSFSGKLCNQRRLNNYGFCVRHILEDPTAPFKRCAYVAKSSNQMCTQAIPRHEERRYCNNHMQVLGMLPKKERKKKEKPNIIAASNRVHTINSMNVKAKFSLSSSKDSLVNNPRPSLSVNNTLEDPYAFTDTLGQDSRSDETSEIIHVIPDSVLGKSLQSGQGFVRSVNDISSTSGILGSTGTSPIAKYYPELAEKLEKMRANPQPKVAPKNRAKSSRTMNKLQTKIAQNKINEKLRKSQEILHTDSNLSPLEISSPETGSIDVDHCSSPAPSLTTFSPESTLSNQFPSNSSLAVYQKEHIGQEVPPLPQIDTSFLATLTAQDNLGFQNASENVLTNKTLSPRTPPRLPPPYPGSSSLSTPSSLTSSDIPPSAFSPQSNLSSVIDSIVNSPQRANLSQVGLSRLDPITTTAIASNSRPGNISSFFTSCPTSYSTSTPTYPFTSQRGGSQQISGISTLPRSMSSGFPPPNVDIFSMLNSDSVKVGTNAAADVLQSTLPRTLNNLPSHLNLPPPPPYVPRTTSPRVSTSVGSKLSSSVATTTSSLITAPVPSVSFTKLHKVNGLLSEKAAKRKLKSDLAVQFYSFYAKKKIADNCLVGPHLYSSEEDTDDDEASCLPWQPDIFSASSDEGETEEDVESDIPMELRPTKLSLLKTRLRRQWCQAKVASQFNTQVRKNSNQATLALIKCIRNSGACAVRTLWQIKQIKRSKKKSRKSKKKLCAHKNGKDGPCKNPCLPCTNHCFKHIMYNIDQQIFDYCTAKFADNTQCCVPVFDIRHELPLCPVHAAKADNYKKQMEEENRKKPRKKSKPPALTRPPRKGKKKKRGRHAKQKTLPVPDPGGRDSSAMSDVDIMGIDTPSKDDNFPVAKPTEVANVKSDIEQRLTNQPQPSLQPIVTSQKESTRNIDHTLDLPETLTDFDKQFDHLAQASGLLEESDLQDVVNKIPFEDLDLFGKNGDYSIEPHQETPSVDLSTSAKTKEALEKLLSGTMSEEVTMQLAMVLAQNLHPDVDLSAEGFGNSSQVLNQDVSMNSETPSLTNPTCEAINPAPSAPNPIQTYQNSQTFYNSTDSSKSNHVLRHTDQTQLTNIQTQNAHSADLNTIFNSVNSSSNSLNLSTSSLASELFSPSKTTVIKQSPNHNMQNLPESGQTCRHPIQMYSSSNSQTMSNNQKTEKSQTILAANTVSSLPIGFNSSSLPVLNAQLRSQDKEEHKQSISHLPTTLSIVPSQSSIQMSSPSRAKRVKLSTGNPNSTVISVSTSNNNSITNINPTCRIVQSVHPTKLTLPDTSLNLRLPASAARQPERNYKPFTMMPHHPPQAKLTLPGVNSKRNTDSTSDSIAQRASFTSATPRLKFSLNAPSPTDILKSKATISLGSNSQTTSILLGSNFRTKLDLGENLINALNSNTDSPEESISVTVRQPDSVPNTVRHTLPDTFPSTVNIPQTHSSILDIPDSSSIKTCSPPQTTLNPDACILGPNILGRQAWVPQAQSISITNGIPFRTNTQTQLNKLSSAPLSKQNSIDAETCLSVLNNAVGSSIPVVSTAITPLPSFAQALSATAFKSTGS